MVAVDIMETFKVSQRPRMIEKVAAQSHCLAAIFSSLLELFLRRRRRRTSFW